MKADTRAGLKRRKESKMEQVTSTVAKQSATRWMVVVLMLALAAALVVYSSPALAQEEAPQEAPQEAQEEAQPPPSDQVTFSFEVTVKGEAGTTGHRTCLVAGPDSARERREYRGDSGLRCGAARCGQDLQRQGKLQ